VTSDECDFDPSFRRALDVASESARSATAPHRQCRDGCIERSGIKQLNAPLTPQKVWTASRDAKTLR